MRTAHQNNPYTHIRTVYQNTPVYAHCSPKHTYIRSLLTRTHLYMLTHGLLNTWTAIFPWTDIIPDANISISNIDTFHVQRLYNYCN